MTTTTFMNYPVRFSHYPKNRSHDKKIDLGLVKTVKVELQILATNRDAAEKLPQHLKYSQKWLSDILEIYEACGAQRFQAIKVSVTIWAVLLANYFDFLG